jgi:predicted DNA-binding protein (MmcQ/YjbR family)
MDFEAARQHLLARPDAWEDFPFGGDVYVYKIRRKMFATLAYRDDVPNMNLVRKLPRSERQTLEVEHGAATLYR